MNTAAAATLIDAPINTTRQVFNLTQAICSYSFEDAGDFTRKFIFPEFNQEITNSDEETYFGFANKRFKVNDDACGGSPNERINTATTNAGTNENNSTNDSGNEEAFEKVGQKRQRTADKTRIKVCKACKLYQTQLKKRSGMCNVCNRVYKFAQEVVEKNNGAMFTFNEETRDFTFTCGFAHTFTAPFDMRQIKFWCSRCTRSERDTRKAYFREADAQKRREMSEMQEKLIMQANAVAGCGGGTNNNCNNNNMTEEEDNTNEDNESDKCYFNNYYDNEEYCQDKYTFKEAFNEGRNNEEEDKGETTTAGTNEINIGQFIRGIGGNIGRTNRMTETEFMEYIVELIIKAPQRRIEQFFENMPKGERVRMFRRLARFVHPDKNAHRFAKEAF